jgi:hypothetical protein
VNRHPPTYGNISTKDGSVTLTAATLPASPARTPLADDVRLALTVGSDIALDALADRSPTDARDRYATLLAIYELHTAPLDRVGEAARLQHHPVVATLKQRCEQEWLVELAALPLPDDLSDDPAGAMRELAARDRLPAVYRWLAKDATWEQVRHFLTLEGGPDAGFDDLVAACQVGLSGSAKMELAQNYWDEMGNGTPADVHTVLNEQLAEAIEMTPLPIDERPTAGLARDALGGLLATNRWLQPEMVGALGLTELQAGPRCRLVLQAFDRCEAPRDAYPYYQVHAEVDPRHGKDWLDNAVEPLTSEHPEWGERILRGALWRHALNRAFFDEVARLVGVAEQPVA